MTDDIITDAEMGRLLKDATIICWSSPTAGPEVQVKFKTLEAAQVFHAALVEAQDLERRSAKLH